MNSINHYIIIFSVYTISLISCKKDEICGIIIDKAIIDDRYYFIFDSDDFNQFGGTRGKDLSKYTFDYKKLRKKE